MVESRLRERQTAKRNTLFYGDTTKQKLSDIIDAILALVFQTNSGATLGLIPDSIKTLNDIKSKLDEILVD